MESKILKTFRVVSMLCTTMCVCGTYKFEIYKQFNVLPNLSLTLYSNNFFRGITASLEQSIVGRAYSKA